MKPASAVKNIARCCARRGKQTMLRALWLSAWTLSGREDALRSVKRINRKDVFSSYRCLPVPSLSALHCCRASLVYK